jgi:hypothetical protein
LVLLIIFVAVRPNPGIVEWQNEVWRLPQWKQRSGRQTNALVDMQPDDDPFQATIGEHRAGLIDET